MAAVFLTMSAIPAVAAAPAGAAPTTECMNGMTVNESGECVPISNPGTAPSVQVAGGVDPIDPESPDSAMNICQYLLDEGQIAGYCPVDQTTLSAD